MKTKTLSLSKAFRRSLLLYTCGNQTTPQDRTIKPALIMLDKLEIEADKNKFFCDEYYNWLIQGSTTDLRSLFKQINIDYWSSLEIGNSIDTLDSVKANFKIKK